VHSFDRPRERSAPRHYLATTRSGEEIRGEIVGLTLVLAVKENCRGCQDVLESPLDAFGKVNTLVVAAQWSSEPWWSTSQHPLIVSASLLRDLDVRWPPMYVLVDPVTQRVVSEGVVFGPAQVREEIAAYLV